MPSSLCTANETGYASVPSQQSNATNVDGVLFFSVACAPPVEGVANLNASVSSRGWDSRSQKIESRIPSESEMKETLKLINRMVKAGLLKTMPSGELSLQSIILKPFSTRSLNAF